MGVSTSRIFCQLRQELSNKDEEMIFPCSSFPNFSISRISNLLGDSEGPATEGQPEIYDLVQGTERCVYSPHLHLCFLWSPSLLQHSESETPLVTPPCHSSEGKSDGEEPGEWAILVSLDPQLPIKCSEVNSHGRLQMHRLGDRRKSLTQERGPGRTGWRLKHFLLFSFKEFLGQLKDKWNLLQVFLVN